MTPPPPTGRRTPRLIPVLDVMGGRVVRAVGGRRTEYRPVVSRLTDSADPLAVARALLATTSAAELYVADLDAITGRSSVTVATLLRALSCRVWVDVGIGGRCDVSALPPVPHVCPVIGFETARTWGVVSETRVARGYGPVALSIDLRNGELVGDWRGWELAGPRDAIGLARAAVRLGAAPLIVLDLARVGTGTGSGTEELLRAIRAAFPHTELMAGGGVRSWADVDRLGDAGADAVLVASALHDGTVTFPRPAP